MNNKSYLNQHFDDQCNLFKPVRRNPFVFRPKTLRKLVPSQAIIHNEHKNDKKSCSTSILTHPDKQLSKPRKTTKSDQTFNKNIAKIKSRPDICKKCGDEVIDKPEYKNIHHRNENIAITRSFQEAHISSQNLNKEIPRNIPKINYKTIEQYYKNENFALSTESVHASQSKNIIKPLSTIKETSEVTLSKPKSSKDILYKIQMETIPEEMGYYNLEKQDNIKKINEFRRRNYFECHSAKSRIKTKASTTSLGEHKCLYRFYLNERLFPVPLNTDYQNNIRCIECKLPLDETRVSQSCNGTIQAKVKLNNKVQDMILMLPVKEPLIIKERRNEINNVNPDILYFGLIKLNTDGNSLFNSTQPSNSFALRYQKGYKEFENIQSYKYDCIDSEDVIII
ncbi:uncharacterized protein LOC123722195 [Papilio machaon]|uniref:uncharacterized protein LOC123722195 n=1 Tax=Papilio machaon TaxID=76193 RepID=UPI001E6642E4|nr:uncharacterized protein LOC123722195 [Papilio machaon]